MPWKGDKYISERNSSKTPGDAARASAARQSQISSAQNAVAASKAARYGSRVDRQESAAKAEVNFEASRSSVTSSGNPVGNVGTKKVSIKGSGGGVDDQPRVPAGSPDGGQWTKG